MSMTSSMQAETKARQRASASHCGKIVEGKHARQQVCHSQSADIQVGAHGYLWAQKAVHCFAVRLSMLPAQSRHKRRIFLLSITLYTYALAGHGSKCIHQAAQIGRTSLWLIGQGQWHGVGARYDTG
ncbi:hypothetical protein MMC29_000185 [Sticta canariensis]|nr:hypothetical protein [Sticta canariensis]